MMNMPHIWNWPIVMVMMLCFVQGALCRMTLVNPTSTEEVKSRDVLPFHAGDMVELLLSTADARCDVTGGGWAPPYPDPHSYYPWDAAEGEGEAPGAEERPVLTDEESSKAIPLVCNFKLNPEKKGYGPPSDNGFLLLAADFQKDTIENGGVMLLKSQKAGKFCQVGSPARHYPMTCDAMTSGYDSVTPVQLIVTMVSEERQQQLGIAAADGPAVAVFLRPALYPENVCVAAGRHDGYRVFCDIYAKHADDVPDSAVFILQKGPGYYEGSSQ